MSCTCMAMSTERSNFGAVSSQEDIINEHGWLLVNGESRPSDSVRISTVGVL